MSDADLARLSRLDAVLHDTGVDAELLLVGGAVLTVVFAHDPGSRRPEGIFGDPDELQRAVNGVAEEAGLAPDWLRGAVRHLFAERGPGFTWQASRVSVFAPRPEYVLALKCAELAGAGLTSAEHTSAEDASAEHAGAVGERARAVAPRGTSALRRLTRLGLSGPSSTPRSRRNPRGPRQTRPAPRPRTGRPRWLPGR